MRTIVVIRHARSTANTAEVPSDMTAEDLAFANRTAELNDEGNDQCLKLAPVLLTMYGIRVNRTRVAVSTFVRTQQSAKRLGFRESLTEAYPQLDEVDHGIELGALRAMLRRDEIPPIALRSAEATLRQAPKENVWMTHGLLIAGLCAVLDV